MLIYLLVSSSSPFPTFPHISVNNVFWSLQPFELDSNSTFTYSCISYTWGRNREPSPFVPSHLISDRTLPALETFTRLQPTCTHLWIDALCVPLEQPSRARTLESMGYIYSCAVSVLVVLSPAARPALTHMLDTRLLDVAVDLGVLEHEEWVERAWTYQESVNCITMLFSCAGDDPVLVEEHRLFDAIGHALNSLRISMVEKMKLYPRLNAFEDIMPERYTAAYMERSVLAVMANMDRRVQERAEDHFYAMIGAISKDPSSMEWALNPCEALMRVCETKGDFSFIFSAAKREDTPGRRWRPVVGDLPSILPWHIWGDKQPGRVCPDGLWLDKMSVAHPAEPKDRLRKFVLDWLRAFWQDDREPEEKLEDDLLATLKAIGFAGSSNWVTTADGYVFAFEPVTTEEVVEIFVSATLGWSMGAPCLVSYKRKDTEKILYTPGAYIGAVSGAETESVLVG